MYQCIVGPCCSRINGAATYDGSNSPYTPVNIFHESRNGYQLVEVSGRDNDDLDVTMTWKQRTFDSETGLYKYVSTSDTLTYTASRIQHIDSITPATGPTGTEVTVAGTAFGFNQGTSTITFNGTPATVTSDHWSDDVITTTVPPDATTGPVVIRTAEGSSNTNKIFTVSSTFYFAEGYTGIDFAEYLCLGNPDSVATTADVTYFFSDGTTRAASYDVPATGRTTINVNSEVGPGKEVSIQVFSNTAGIVAERPMYFDYQRAWTGGSNVVGTNSSATTWFFAEGTTRDDFNEFLCLQNPGNVIAHVTITYYATSGQAINKSWAVSANSRLTVNVNADAGADQDISARVSSDSPIIVERPMYFDYNGWTGGHAVVGF